MSTDNQKVLAKIQTDGAIIRARQMHLESPQTRAMKALRDAIDGKRNELEAFILAGKVDTDAYRQTKAQLARWTEAWNSNR